jgi:hypothetical protein
MYMEINEKSGGGAGLFWEEGGGYDIPPVLLGELKYILQSFEIFVKGKNNRAERQLTD